MQQQDKSSRLPVYFASARISLSFISLVDACFSFKRRVNVRCHDLSVTTSHITMPNAFSPNSDGDNDIFRILAAGFKKLNYFKIYDRWGEEVFFTNYFRRGWDGTYKGRDCEVGTYFWIISAIDIDNKEKTIKGDVTLLR
jgi:gliding motility-associated-like protein